MLPSAFMQTFTGKRFTPLAPRLEDISLEDTAHSLAGQARFGGHTRDPYSIAQHAVLVALDLYHRTGDPVLAFWGLHHDDSEAYLVDLPRPIKKYTNLGKEYELLEEPIMKLVAKKYGLSWPEPTEVKISDNRVLLAEKRDLFDCQIHKWEDMGVEPFEHHIEPWPARLAEETYLLAHERFYAN